MKRTVCMGILFILFGSLSPAVLARNSRLPFPTVELLKKLIQINTTNPPGNEIVAARFVQDYLSRFGISSEVIESAPGRGNLVARLPGKGTKEPLMLLAHLDVVTADPKEWSHPPFAADIADHYLYGRGAMDMKGMAALMIQTFLKIKLKNIPLGGDLLLVLVADEEAGGKYGAEFLVKNYWDKIKSGVVLNEGSIGLIWHHLHLYPVQVAEKGVAWLKLTASGTSGHGSMPIPDNATVILIKALNKLITQKQPIQKTPIVAEFLDRLSPHLKFPTSFFLRHLFDFPFRQLVPWLGGDKIKSDKILNAMLRNTVVPTVLRAGSKTNVIPATATAEVDCRILPGETPQQFRNGLEKVISDPRVRLELLTSSQPNASKFQNPIFQAIETSIRESDPKAVVLPFISPGATDMRFFREKGSLAYGIIPFLISTEDLKGLHGQDERISVEEIQRGEKLLWYFVLKIQALANP